MDRRFYPVVLGAIFLVAVTVFFRSQRVDELNSPERLQLENNLRRREIKLREREKEIAKAEQALSRGRGYPTRTHELFRTKDGRHIQEVMDTYDERLLSKWPANIDLIVRTGTRDAGLLPFLFKSIDLFWPKGIGKVIVILDANEHFLVRGVIPDYAELYFESFLPGIPGRLGNQWSNFWADNYTSSEADFVAVIDSDCVLQTKVTPDLLFYKGTDKLIVVGHPTLQTELYKPGNDWWLGLGDEGYHANFMWALPFVYPRWMLPEFREHIFSKHQDLGYFDNIMIEWAKKTEWNNFSQFGLLGNYMYHFHKEKFHFAFEDIDEPALRYASHVFISPFYQNVLHGPPSPPKVQEHYVNASLTIINEGICYSIPPGELTLGCEQYKGTMQDPLWMYVWWNTWGQSNLNYNATAVYTEHFQNLYKLYPIQL